MVLDHVVIKVDDLALAVEDYRSCGFHVEYGGEHKAFGSRNALIALADGCYLELVAFEMPEAHWLRVEQLRQLQQAGDSRLAARWLSLRGVQPGLADFALRVDDFAELEATLDIEGPVEMGRERPDGKLLRWQMGHPATLDLPFLIHDLTDLTLRIPEQTDHPNGAAGVCRLVVAVSSLDESRARYQQLLGDEGQPTTLADYKTAPAHAFDLSHTRIVLLQADDEAPAQHVRQHGESVYQIGVHFHDVLPNWPTHKLHGARIETWLSH